MHIKQVYLSAVCGYLFLRLVYITGSRDPKYKYEAVLCTDCVVFPMTVPAVFNRTIDPAAGRIAVGLLVRQPDE